MALVPFSSSTINTFFARFFSKPNINWQSKDFYERLGLKPDAKSDEIKKRYSELVRAYHPDLLKEGEKEEGQKIMESVNEAYDVLQDEKRRAEYDQERAGGPNIFGMKMRPSHQMIYRQTVNLTFQESLFGCNKKITLNAQETCPKCHGNCTADGSPPTACQDCQGSGLFFSGLFPIPCPRCQGKGFTVQNPCKQCNGSGHIPKPIEVAVDFPAGVDRGSLINLQTQEGIFQILCNVKDDPIFYRDGYDLHIIVPISVKTAILGGMVDIPTLKGIQHKRVRPGTQPNDVETMVGGGIANRGDLFIHYKMIVPRSLSRKDKKILQNVSDSYMADNNMIWNSIINNFEKERQKTLKH